MLRKRVQSVLMSLGLGAILVVSMGAWGIAGPAPQAPVQPAPRQVREIKIDQYGLEPGTWAGSLALEQPRDQEVALALPAGTAIQRGEQPVHLAAVGHGGGARAGGDPGCRPRWWRL
jgi:hypothetical protein